MLVARAAALFFLASLAAAQSDTSPGPLGGSSQHLVVAAVKFAHANWDPKACLASVELSKNATIDRGEESWDFGFIVPGADRRIKVSIMGAGSPFLVDNGLQGMSAGCIREMSVDSHRAVEIALRHGLNYAGSLLGLKLFLAEPGDFSDGDNLLHRRPDLHGKTIWRVTTEDSRTFLIDAKTGKVLDKEEK